MHPHARVHTRAQCKQLNHAAVTHHFATVTSRSLPSNTTSYHIWFGKAPDLSHMRVFASQCWYVLPKKDVKKLDARTREALMMGYSSQSKGYKLWDGIAGKFVVSRDVIFNEKSSNDCQELSNADLQHDSSSELTLKDETAPEPSHAKDNLDKDEHVSLEESDPFREPMSLLRPLNLFQLLVAHHVSLRNPAIGG